MLDLNGMTKADLCNLALMDPSIKVNMRMNKAAIIATLLQATGLDAGDVGEVQPTLPDPYVYPATDSAPSIAGSYALYHEDLEAGIGTDGVATEDLAREVLGVMEDHYSKVDQTDDKIRHCHVKDGRFKGAAPRLMVASVLGYTAESLEAPKVWATRTNLRVWETTTGEDEYYADVNAKLDDAPIVKVEGPEGERVPLVRPTPKVVPFAVPVSNAQRAIAVFYRDSTEKHEAISGLRKASFLGVVPSGKSYMVKSFVTPNTIAQVLVRLGVGLPSQSRDGSDLPEGKRPLVMVPAFDAGVADYLGCELGYDSDDIDAAMTMLAASKYALAAARASGRKVRENDESARRAQDGRHHEFRLRDAGATALADASVALARAAR